MSRNGDLIENYEVQLQVERVFYRDHPDRMEHVKGDPLEIHTLQSFPGQTQSSRAHAYMNELERLFNAWPQLKLDIQNVLDSWESGDLALAVRKLAQSYERIEDPTNTNDDFWECACESEYIHHKSQSSCAHCETTQSMQPDARQSDIVAGDNLHWCAAPYIEASGHAEPEAVR